MKKLLTVLLTLLMVFTLVGCNSKEDESTMVNEPVVEQSEQQETVEEVKQEESEIAGGFVDAEDPTITDELKEIFETALNGLLGAKYEPVKLLATQVVNGINYKFLANGTKTTNPITIGTYSITINKSTDGIISLLDIEVIEEKQEEKKTVDPTIYDYWVVVYDQFGNEISRTTAHYGTTIKDPDGNDVVVKGNTYFHTTIDYSSSKKEDDGPAPSPTPDPADVNFLYIKNYGSESSCIQFNTGGAVETYQDLAFQYSKDKQNWIDIDFDTDIEIPVGETLYFKAKTTNDHVYYYPESGSGGGVYITDNEANVRNNTTFEVGGSIMTLLDPTDTLRDLTGKPGCFYYLFYSFKNMVKADNLVFPATTLSYSCYGEAFDYCSYMESINPDLLPATDLTGGNYCCYYMFYYCDALQNAPKLPATTLCDYCYNGMFNNCSSLNSIEVNFDSFDSLPDSATSNWLSGVSATGTFKWPGPTIGFIPGASTIPSGWTITN